MRNKFVLLFFFFYSILSVHTPVSAQKNIDTISMRYDLYDLERKYLRLVDEESVQRKKIEELEKKISDIENFNLKTVMYLNSSKWAAIIMVALLLLYRTILFFSKKKSE